MAAMGILEKKAIEYELAGDYKSAGDIYEKLADLRLDVYMAANYISCMLSLGKVTDSLKMIDKYVKLLKDDTKPQYKCFYLQASIAAAIANRPEEALYFAKLAEKCDPDDDFILYQRLSYENTMGSVDNVRVHEQRILEFVDRFITGQATTDGTPSSMHVATWFTDDSLVYGMAKRAAQRLNGTRTVFEHKPSVDHFIKPKIRIGYFCGHVRAHPSMHAAWDHFAQHNKERFETHGFFYNADYSYKGAKAFANSLDGYSNLDDMSDLEAAQYIKDMEIDVLVDLSSIVVEGARGQILAHKPAPVMMQYQGYHCTSGLDAMDYVITDPYSTLPSDTEFYTEKLAFLPVFFQTSKWQPPIDKSLQNRKKWGLPEDAFVFANMCSAIKYTPEMLKAWMVILDNVNDSVLWIAEPSYDETKRMFHHYAEINGVNPDRIIFAKRTKEKDDHMSRLPCIDVHLDTNIFCGHTTTVDMVDMGVFPLCLEGKHIFSRVSASIMQHIGCGDMVAKDIEEYIKTAVVLGRDKALAKTWSEHMYQQACKNGLFDTKALVGHLENAYETAYIRWASGLAPDHFMASPLTEEDVITMDNVDHLVNQETHDRISQYGEQA